jgi:hypothetical protein
VGNFHSAFTITSNRTITEWGMVFGDAVVATAILDRLLHHSHVVTIRSDSYRLRAAQRPCQSLAKGISSSCRQGGNSGCRLTIHRLLLLRWYPAGFPGDIVNGRAEPGSTPCLSPERPVVRS